MVLMVIVLKDHEAERLFCTGGSGEWKIQDKSDWNEENADNRVGKKLGGGKDLDVCVVLDVGESLRLQEEDLGGTRGLDKKVLEFDTFLGLQGCNFGFEDWPIL